VGAARNHQDSDEGYCFVPKLILAGRLTGTMDGRPVVIEADDSGLLVRFADFRTAWAVRKTAEPLLSVLAWLRQVRVPLRVCVAGLFSVELLPIMSPVVKLIAPGFRRAD
jgi:hypothetical protein